MRERWESTWAKLDRPEPDGLFEAIAAAYAEPHRAYHTGQHLAECFAQLDACPVAAASPAAVELALWFHDAIYDTKASDNEKQSAAWARRALVDLPPELVDRVEGLILVTEHAAEPGSADERLVLDVDLSILGAERPRFDEYERQVRVEYGWVPEDAYRSARARILRQFFERPVLYHVPWFRDRLEPIARVNLERSIAAAESGA